MLRFILLAAILVSISSFADPCRLNLVFPKKSPLTHPVSASVQIKDQTLIAHFDVQTDSIHAKPELKAGEYPYMFDVVEVFFTASESGYPYYEFELSPYNQTLQVEVVDPKKPFIENADLGLTTSVALTKGGWQGTLRIPLPAGADFKNLRGNLYAILGQKPLRSYWSTFLGKQSKPNFHQPQFFQPLVQCEVKP